MPSQPRWEQRYFELDSGGFSFGTSFRGPRGWHSIGVWLYQRPWPSKYGGGFIVAVPSHFPLLFPQHPPTQMQPPCHAVWWLRGAGPQQRETELTPQRRQTLCDIRRVRAGCGVGEGGCNLSFNLIDVAASVIIFVVVTVSEVECSRGLIYLQECGFWGVIIFFSGRVCVYCVRRAHHSGVWHPRGSVCLHSLHTRSFGQVETGALQPTLFFE